MNTTLVRVTLWATLIALLSACSSPPKPPTVDESQKRPANAQPAVELQVCKNDLQNTRIQAVESDRLAETTAAINPVAAPRAPSKPATALFIAAAAFSARTTPGCSVG